MRATPLATAALACLLALAACGDSDDSTAETTTEPQGEGDGGTTTTGGGDGEESTAGSTEGDTTGGGDADAADEINGGKPDVAAGEGDPPSELEIEDLVVGTGDEAVAGAPIEVHYVGVLFEDGEQFDASWDRGATFDFTLGQGEVIPGWDEGVEGMRVGGRRRIVIPPDLAYGDSGAGDAIGPGATLIFVVDLVSVAEPVPAVDPADKPDVEVPDPLPTQLEVDDIEEGDGAEATAGSTAVVHIVGLTASDGEEFDSTWEEDRPISFRLGLNQVIPGLDQGVEGMKVGGRRLIVIPPGLAFGEGGNGPIGPGETLVLVADLVAVR